MIADKKKRMTMLGIEPIRGSGSHKNLCTFGVLHGKKAVKNSKQVRDNNRSACEKDNDQRDNL